MLAKTLKAIILRDLDKLKAEIELYTDEKNLWRFEKQIANSAGNLCLHLVGNLNTYIGVAIGQTDYIRQRDLEFSLKNVPKTELLEKIEATKIIVATVLDSLTPADFEKMYPMEVSVGETTTEYYLVHITSHLAYHLGQINYHRRILDAS